VLTHSADEEVAVRSGVPAARVVRVPWTVPAAQHVPLSPQYDIAFIGDYAAAPNEDATRQLAGAAVPARLETLNRNGVRAIGHALDLVRQLRDGIRLAVAPLRFGAGLMAKVFDSLTAGVPCGMVKLLQKASSRQQSCAPSSAARPTNWRR